MPVRIYALAKELGVPNEQLLDACEQAGVSGKSSALASLSDDETTAVKSFLQGGGGAIVAEPDTDDLAPVRPDPAEIRAEPIRQLPSTPAPTAEEVEEEFQDTQELEEQPEEVQAEAVEPSLPELPAVPTPSTPAPTSKSDSPLGNFGNRPKDGSPKPAPPTKAKPKGPTKPTKRPSPPSRQPLRPAMERPSGAGNRQLRNLDSKQQSSQKSDKPNAKKPRPGGNVIRVAAMPEIKQPSGRSSNSNEKVQKPDIALGKKDAARAKKAGGSAPLDQFNRQSKTDAGNKKRRGGGAGGGFQQPGEILGEMPGRGGARRGRGDKARGERETTTEGGGAGMGSRPQRTKRRRGRRDDDGYRPQFHRRRTRKGPAANTAAPRKDDIVLQMPCSVRSFSEAAGIPAVKVLLTIQQIDEMFSGTINSILSDDSVELLVDHFELENIDVRAPKSLEDDMLTRFEELSAKSDEAGSLRPPIVTFLGHVDHGKTSLLDAIIGIDVVSGEAGGITQHIRAYEVHKADKKIAFVDTPGHEAFTEMRARGANVTDIAVLVVAADDGVMPQTEEAISHAKAAEVPIVVALNKIDLPGANPDKALQDLASHELLPSEWGGDIEVVRTSAIKGEGIDELLETILTIAELNEFKANPKQDAYGTCLEAEQESDRGVMAKIMVQTGTLEPGDVVVCGQAYGRVRAMYDTLRPNKKIKKAGPSTPINLSGLNVAPEAGDKIYVLDDIAKAREIAESREYRMRFGRVGGISIKTSLIDFQQQLAEGTLGQVHDVVKLNLIIRADVRGSIEAIRKELGKIKHPEIAIEIRQALVGGVSIADVRLAQATGAVIVAFNVVPDEAARSLADELQVEIRRYDIIYKVTDDVRLTLEGKLKPEEQIVEQGMAMVLQTFSISKTGTIAGCRVMRGNILRECHMRVIRDNRVIGEYPIDTLKRVKDDVKEVQRGMECGIKLQGYNDIKEGDTLEAFRVEEVARKLEMKK